MTLTSILDEVLEAWGYARQGVLAELRNLPADAFGFRPAAGSRTVAELAQHILQSGLLMSGELTRPDGDFRRKTYVALLREHGGDVQRYRSKVQLLAALTRAHAEGERKIRRAGELFMLQHIRRFDGLMGTRHAWMQHGIAHEEYHRGQLALYARLLGKVPALTQRIHGKG
jgi:uncharacterized damage-inducible protein DinB